MGNHTEIAYIFLYVAAFGISDYIVEKYKLMKNMYYYSLYFGVIFLVGLFFLYDPLHGFFYDGL